MTDRRADTRPSGSRDVPDTTVVALNETANIAAVGAQGAHTTAAADPTPDGATDDLAVAATGSMRVAAMGDIHIVENDEHDLTPLFAEISAAASALVLCGDLTDTGKPAEAKRLAAQLKACTVPVMAVLGNHDHESGEVDEVRAILKDAGVRLIEGAACEIDGVGFVGAKGFAGGFGTRMLGSFGEAATKSFVTEAMNEAMQLENAMRTVKAGRSMVVLHYAPIVDTVVGEPTEIYPFLGCSRLAETIDRFPVDAVVHGHAHRGTYEGRTPRGTPVFNVAYGIDKPSGRPYALIDV